MRQLPVYDPNARCPKCSHDDISTRYVKQGRYGEPCEFLPAELREHEHLHRHCRRCSYAWCEACPDPQPATAPAPAALQQVAALRPTLDQLRAVGDNWANLLYALEKYAAAYDLLLTRYAKFHIDDRVQIGVTPAIDATLAPGWLASKHFLVAGAYGTVRDVDVRGGAFYYQIVCDAESWLDDKRIEHAVPPEQRHAYCFAEGYLVKAAAPKETP